MQKRELVALFCLPSWCLASVLWLFLAMPRGCLQFVIVVFPDHTQLPFLPRNVAIFLTFKWYVNNLSRLVPDDCL